MTARRIRILLALAVPVTALILAGLSCRVTGVTPEQATATYGAGVFHAQLTAQAKAQP